jgi:radical SAM superfamily enzyme YgiQ (UPF0313 family)
LAVVRVLLLSTYELGHQPLHVAAPAGALERAGHDVRCVDLDAEAWDPAAVAWADVVAVSVPMHTALRLARDATTAVRRARPTVPVCFYGLYAAVDDGADHEGAADVRIAGEYVTELVALVDRLARSDSGTGALEPRTRIALGRSGSGLPARRLLPDLQRYARVAIAGEERPAGYVEASHGCAHRCRHCPVPVVYDGRTRVVAVDELLADVGQLVEAGARHLTFGDPDFLNGPHHARRVVAAVHDAYPELTFDITAKVSHVLAHRGLWPELAAAGCVFVVSAYESASEVVLRHLDKGHTVADEVEATRLLRRSGIEPRPSLLPFTPWTTATDLADLVELVEACDLVGNVDPVQWSIRLLVPPGSLLLDGGALDGLLGAYDAEHLGWRWKAPDPRFDMLHGALAETAQQAGAEGWGPERAHEAVRSCIETHLGDGVLRPWRPADADLRSSLAPVDRPRLTEAWFCCAEPTAQQRRGALAVAAGTAP